MTARTLKPSDLVTWRDSRDLQTRRLHKLGEGTTWLDRMTGREFNREARNFTCRIEYMGNDPLGHMNPDDDHWMLITQGEARGGRRYRWRLTQEQAERMALAWLDRRFKVIEEAV